MAEIDGEEGVGMHLRLLLSDGSSAGYHLTPAWEFSSPVPTGGRMAAVSKDATASLPELVADEAAAVGEQFLEAVEVTLSTTRHGECVASFPLVPATTYGDVGEGDLPQVYSQISLAVDTSEGCIIARLHERKGSQRKWISTAVYSLSMIPEEDFRPLEPLLGKKMLVFRSQGILDVQCPPLRLNFKKNFKCEKKLGEGMEGDVFKCLPSFSRNRCAVKKIIKEDLFITPDKREPSDVNLLAMLSHANIAQFYFAWTELEKTNYGSLRNATFVGMELCVTSLMHYLRETAEVEHQTADHIFRQLMEGLKYMHQQDVVHRDIKPDNILLTGNLTVKIADLGIAKRKQRPNILSFHAGDYGYTLYRAPEIINTYTRHDEKVDIFSCGLIYLELHMPGVRQREDKLRRLSTMIPKGMRTFDELGLAFNLDSLLDGTDILTGWKGEYNILKKMLLPNPTERPSACEVLAMLPTSSDSNHGELQ